MEDWLLGIRLTHVGTIVSGVRPAGPSSWGPCLFGAPHFQPSAELAKAAQQSESLLQMRPETEKPQWRPVFLPRPLRPVVAEGRPCSPGLRGTLCGGRTGQV